MNKSLDYLGLRFELQDEKDPTQLWMVSVSENSGGLLGQYYPVPTFGIKNSLKTSGYVSGSFAILFRFPQLFFFIGYDRTKKINQQLE